MKLKSHFVIILHTWRNFDNNSQNRLSCEPQQVKNINYCCHANIFCKINRIQRFPSRRTLERLSPLYIYVFINCCYSILHHWNLCKEGKRSFWHNHEKKDIKIFIFSSFILCVFPLKIIFLMELFSIQGFIILCSIKFMYILFFLRPVYRII